MIRLDTTTRKLQAILAGAVATNQLPITVCYSDKTATAYSGGTSVINTNSGTAVDICAAPAASTVRDIDTINVNNADTANATVTIRYNDNGTTYTLFKAVLSTGDQLTYVHGTGWSVKDSTGAEKVVSGSVFGPSSSTDNAIVRFDGTTGKLVQDSAVTIDDTTGSMTFTGTSVRIKGDFSNATAANRVMFQSSTTNGASDIGIVPNGTAVRSQLLLWNSSTDQANSGYAGLVINGVRVGLDAGIAGTGTYLPMTFYTGGAESFRLNADASGGYFSGNYAGTKSVRIINTDTGATSAAQFYVQSNNGLTALEAYSTAQGGSTNLRSTCTGTFSIYSTNGILSLGSNGASNDLVFSSGNVTKNTATGALGYGTGSAGTVVQATSRTTAVTLNKPAGAITMFTAAGSPTPAQFSVNNSLVTSADTIILSVKSGTTNIYAFHVGAVGSGSFIISFWAQSGTASDTPVINFAVIKGATS